MSYLIRISEDAEKDIGDTYSFYEGIRTGLDECISRVEHNPVLYRFVYEPIRRVPLKRFPHRLFYLVDGPVIYVVAVFHAQRSPSALKR